MILIYDRASKAYCYERQYGQKQLEFLYHTVPGRILLKAATSRWFSNMIQRSKERKGSTRKIAPFVEEYGIRMDDFETKEYTSFNDFFTRRLAEGKRNVCTDDQRIISPADAKLLVYPITDTCTIHVKHTVYHMDTLLRDEKLAQLFLGGTCFVYRLSVDDYHRYCYVDSGSVTQKRKIDGVLHTVSSIADNVQAFTENCREYCLIATKRGDTVLQMEVGAMLVGRIVNASDVTAVKGVEKGYFSYGGSTIIVLYEKGCVMVDADIMEKSREMIETKVRYGEAVGRILC